MRPPPAATPPAAQVKVVSPLFEFGQVQPCRHRARQRPIPRTAITPAPTDISRCPAPVSRGRGFMEAACGRRTQAQSRRHRNAAPPRPHEGFDSGPLHRRAQFAVTIPRSQAFSDIFWLANAAFSLTSFFRVHIGSPSPVAEDGRSAATAPNEGQLSSCRLEVPCAVSASPPV